MWTKCKQHGERLRIPPKNFLKLWIMWITFWVTAETDMLSLADEAKSEVGIHNFCSPCGMLIGVLLNCKKRTVYSTVQREESMKKSIKKIIRCFFDGFIILKICEQFLLFNEGIFCLWQPRTYFSARSSSPISTTLPAPIVIRRSCPFT